MYIVPAFQTEEGFLFTEETTENVKIIKESNRHFLTIENCSGGFTSARAIPFMSKEEEQALVLKEEKKNSGKTNTASLIIYAKFVTTTISYIFFGGKKIQILKEDIPDEIYIFDGQVTKGNEINVVPAKKLPTILDSLEGWPANVVENIEKNPEKMCLLFYHNQNLVWLENYFLVSELKNKK